jgi:hypothetical protein
LRCLIVKAEFDGYETVWAPLSDFSGGGMGAPPVESYFLSAGGNGNISCRFPMPYQNTGKITVLNCFNREADIVLQAHADDYEWKTSSLYFHASWRQETEIPVTNRWENCRDWNFATLQGKGVFKGDVLTLFNHTTSWYGEGDEKIYVDGEAFPSHFGTGTEDYYNCSWAPVSPFHTPFGGAPRADYDSSTGYNTFLRLRCLDGIPFESRLQFDIEMLSWTEGTVDYATTVFWYGEGSAIATGASGVEEATRELLPSPENPLNYTIPNSLEFEDLIPAEQSPSLATEIQDMTVFSGFKWSKAKQLLCRNASQGDYLLYRFENYKPVTYRIQVQGTKAVDYGILSFSVNGNPLINADLYHNSVVHSGIISLGEYTPENGCFEIKIIYSGKSRSATGNLFGLDCIQFIEADFKVANAIELEGYAHASVEGLSSHFAQNMDAYRNGKWSERHQKVYTAFVRGNSVDFLFPHWGSDSCSLTLYATRGPDFGILSFQVNGEALHLKYDCYHDLVSDTGPVKLGRFLPQADGSIHLRINVTGTNPFSAHPKYIVGLDCILIEKHTPESLTDQKAGPPSYRILDKTLYIHSTDRVNETILFNLLGMQVLKTQDSRLDISSLAKGVYIVLFNFGETKLTEKIHIN